MSLYQKYRPTTIEQYMGAVKIPKKAKAFLITGSSGCGKTTLARIICSENNLRILEINAADNKGIDTARELGEYCKYKPVDGRSYGIILDEAHQMTKATQECLLKYTEDVPEWITWFVLTTEPARLIDTLKQRLSPIKVKCPNTSEMKMIVKRAANGEKFKLTEEQLERLSQCDSPRIALVQLENVIAGNEISEEVFDDNPELIEFPRLMMSAKNADKLRAWILENKKNTDAESARQVAMAYMTTILCKKSDKTAIKWLDLLCQADCWRNKWAALIVAIELYFH